MHSVVRPQVLFTAGMLLCGLIEALAAYLWVGINGVEGVAYSTLLCLIPGWLTIFSSSLLKDKGLAAYTILVGTGLRMAFVLIGAVALSTLRHDLGFREFTIWLIPSYMIALSLETIILLAPTLSPAVSQVNS